jgi:two-component system, sensor histidine kinase and response regulator
VGAQVAGAAADKGLALAVVVHRSVPARLSCDPVRLKQVVLNLASNAVKFTARGEVVLRVLVEGDRLVLAVRDTGIGIEPEVQARLFQPFTQADASTTRRFGGTGLGLSISRSLVVSMGGALSVESVPGAGSTFRVEVPLREAVPVSVGGRRGRVLARHRHAATQEGLIEALVALGYEVVSDELAADVVVSDEDGPRRPRVLLSRLGAPGRGAEAIARQASGVVSLPARPAHLDAVVARALGAVEPSAPSQPLTTIAPRPATRVLVAEDNAINQQVILRMLEKLGLSADVAGDGLEAVAAMERTDYALVLMDCQMPRCDGYGAARAIRSLPGPRSKVPIVAVTASALEDERERCLAAGIDDYLAKPVRLNELEQMLETWLA